jgi:HD-GYP domain-containing protein (c-di-GMP phosphodiesterase class II)
MASALASALRLPNRIVLDVKWAGRLHDLGKVVVDNSILHKQAALDEREWDLMRSHPNVSAELLEPLSLTRRLGPGVRFHHERQDGGGYFGVYGDDIPIEAALITIADSYDAMTTDRPYRKAMTREQALGRIEELSGTQFHPEFARAFVAMMRGEPVEEASMVRSARARRRLWWRRARGDDPVDSARAWPEMPDLAEPAEWAGSKTDVSETHVS